MPRVTPCELINTLTGYRTVFPNTGLAEDYLKQTHGYIRKHLMNNTPILNRQGTPYKAKLLPSQKVVTTNQPNYPRQLCWDCEKALGGCSWSRHFKPIEGWDAIYIPDRPQNPATYSIIACPEFVEG